jgi:hypothetical protein
MKEEYDFSKGKRGAIEPTPLGKTRITIRLDNEIIDWFRDKVEARGGGNYQTMINNALRVYISQNVENLEEIIRRVIKEEIDDSSSKGIAQIAIKENVIKFDEWGTQERPIKEALVTKQPEIKTQLSKFI